MADCSPCEKLTADHPPRTMTAYTGARGVTSLGPGLLTTMGVAAIGIRFLSLLSYFVQGPAEELLFRGWLLSVIGARYRPWIGVLSQKSDLSNSLTN